MAVSGGWCRGSCGCGSGGVLPERDQAYKVRLVQGELTGKRVAALDPGEREFSGCQGWGGSLEVMILRLVASGGRCSGSHGCGSGITPLVSCCLRGTRLTRHDWWRGS